MWCRRLCQSRYTPYYLIVCCTLLVCVTYKGGYLRCTISINDIKAAPYVGRGERARASTGQKKNTPTETLIVNIRNSDSLDYTPRKCVGKHTKDDHQFVEVLKDVFVYSAFLDVRNIDNKPKDRTGAYTIRIMAVLPSVAGDANHTYYCMGLLASGQYWSMQVSFYQMHEAYNNDYEMYILSCRLPPELSHTPPCSVLISPSRVPTNPPRWIHVQSPATTLKHKVETCVPPLFGDISPQDLIEFIELSRLFGVEHIRFYDYRASVSIVKVLSYYEKRGFVSVLPWRLDRRLENKQLHYHGQMLCVQDCLYRSMFTSHFVAFMDIDEMFVPRRHSDWFSLMQNYTEFAGVSATSAFFDPLWGGDSQKRGGKTQLPRLKMATHTTRTKVLSTRRTKCIVNPRHVFEMGVHTIILRSPRRMKLDKPSAYVLLLHHYRLCPVKSPSDSCEERVIDNTLSVYVAQLEANVKRVLVSLKIN